MLPATAPLWERAGETLSQRNNVESNRKGYPNSSFGIHVYTFSSMHTQTHMMSKKHTQHTWLHAHIHTNKLSNPIHKQAILLRISKEKWAASYDATFVISMFVRLKQKDHGFKASLESTVLPCLKKKSQKVKEYFTILRDFRKSLVLDVSFKTKTSCLTDLKKKKTLRQPYETEWKLKNSCWLRITTAAHVRGPHLEQQRASQHCLPNRCACQLAHFKVGVRSLQFGEYSGEPTQDARQPYSVWQLPVCVPSDSCRPLLMDFEGRVSCLS